MCYRFRWSTHGSHPSHDTHEDHAAMERMSNYGRRSYSFMTPEAFFHDENMTTPSPPPRARP